MNYKIFKLTILILIILVMASFTITRYKEFICKNLGEEWQYEYSFLGGNCQKELFGIKADAFIDNFKTATFYGVDGKKLDCNAIIEKVDEGFIVNNNCKEEAAYFKTATTTYH